MVTISVCYIIFFEYLRKSGIHWKPAEKIGSVFYFMYSILNTFSLVYIIYKFINDDVFQSVNLYSISSLSTSYLQTSEWILIFKIYYLSKMYEYSDLILVHLTNKITIGNHFRLHHYTTLSLSYTFINPLNNKTIPFHCLIFLFNNVLMHSMVYLFHSNMIPSIKESNIFWYMTRIQGYNQLLSGFIFCFTYNFIYDKFNVIYLWTLFCYSLYFTLFQIEIYESWKLGKKKYKKIEDKNE